MDHFELFKLLLSPGDVILDVGAHRGYYARKLSTILQGKGKVYSFEPHPEKFLDLKDVASHFPKNIIANCLAISDVRGRVTLHYGVTPEADQASTICSDLANENRLGSEIRQVTVDATTIDRFCKENGVTPNFVKIDVEGAEDKAIAGMAAVIRDYKPSILFECGCDDKIPPHFQALRDLGYRLWIVDITRFFPPDYSWATAKESSASHLSHKIFTFTEAELSHACPAHVNVLCIHQSKIGNKIPSDAVMSLETALQHLCRPRRSWKLFVAQYMPKKMIEVLRAVKQRHFGQ